MIESERTRQVDNWLQYFRPEALEGEFREAGLLVKGIESDAECLIYRNIRPTGNAQSFAAKLYLVFSVAASFDQSFLIRSLFPLIHFSR